jgi:hypothetical protein
MVDDTRLSASEQWSGITSGKYDLSFVGAPGEAAAVLVDVAVGLLEAGICPNPHHTQMPHTVLLFPSR